MRTSLFVFFILSLSVLVLCIVDEVPKKFTREDIKRFKEAKLKNEMAQIGLSAPKGSFDRIFIIQFENQPFHLVEKDPNFKKAAQMGVLLTNYYGTSHPSQPSM